MNLLFIGEIEPHCKKWKVNNYSFYNRHPILKG
jgi:hypothetical protein